MIRQLNQWGPRQCAERIEEIVGHLLRQSDRLPARYRWAVRTIRGVPGFRGLAAGEARRLVEQAISRAGVADEGV
jgi:hypothetical protein